MRLTPALAVAHLLERFKAAFPKVYRFWPDEVGLTDRSLFDLTVLTGPQRTTAFGRFPGVSESGLSGND